MDAEKECGRFINHSLLVKVLVRNESFISGKVTTTYPKNAKPKAMVMRIFLRFKVA
jgi:hypothetical protein